MDIRALNEQGRIDWKRALPRLAIVVGGIVAIVLVLVWLISALKGDKQPSQPEKLSSAVQQSPENRQTSKSRNSNSSNTGSSNNSTSNPAPSPSSSTAAPSQTPSNLANSGPGETVALFTIAAGTGTIIYQTYLRRRSLQ